MAVNQTQLIRLVNDPGAPWAVQPGTHPVHPTFSSNSIPNQGSAALTIFNNSNHVKYFVFRVVETDEFGTEILEVKATGSDTPEEADL